MPKQPPHRSKRSRDRVVQVFFSAPFLAECSTATRAIRSDRQRSRAARIATTVAFRADSAVPPRSIGQQQRSTARWSTSASDPADFGGLPRNAPAQSQQRARRQCTKTLPQRPALTAKANADAAPKSQPPNL